MSRLYTDQVEVDVVRTADGLCPQAFLWRRMRYQVWSVLARWVEGAPWWRDAIYRRDESAYPGAGASRSQARVAQATAERRVWRVEASGPSGRRGVYDLCCFDDRVGDAASPESKSWFLIRALD